MAEGGPKARRLRDALRLLANPKRLWRERRRLAIGLIAAAVLLLAGGVVAYQELKRPADVHNQEAIESFERTKPPPEPNRAKTVNWPMFGLNPARTRFLPAKGVKPPYRKLWRYTDRPLLEFPPIFVRGTLYALNNNAEIFALDADTGRELWKRRIGRLNASSPTYHRGRLYVVNLVPGHVLKLDARTGKTIWKRDLPGRAESSPVVIDRTVYFGCEDGNLYALSTVNGNVRWSTPLGGPVKAAPAFQGGRLFVGDYGGYMNAVDAETGELLWQSGSLGPGFGQAGAFYSTPAVAFGRVYAGNNDGRVYSYVARTGELAWSYSTGGYAYSGPTVTHSRHSPPTAFIGSFDGNVYALDAKDGDVRWSRPAGGQVIGSLSAVGDIVYVAEFTEKTTSGFMMRSGKKVFEYPYGTYTPVISDGRRIYLTGYSSITALQPFKHRRALAEARLAPARSTRGELRLLRLQERRARRAAAVRRARRGDLSRARALPEAVAEPSGSPSRRTGRGESGGGR